MLDVAHVLADAGQRVLVEGAVRHPAGHAGRDRCQGLLTDPLRFMHRELHEKRGRHALRDDALLRRILDREDLVAFRRAELRGAADRHHQLGGAGAAVGIGDGVAEHLGQRLAVAERGDAGVAGVHLVAIAAVRIHAQAAVCAGQRPAADHARASLEGEGGHGLGHDIGTDAVADVARSAPVRPEHVAADCGHAWPRGVDRGGVVARGRHIVDHQHAQRARTRVAIAVAHDDGDVVRHFAARMRLPAGQRVAVGDGTGRRVVAGEREQALVGHEGDRRRPELRQLCRGQRGAGDLEAAEAVGRADHEAAGGGLARVAAVAQPALADGGLAGAAGAVAVVEDQRHAVFGAADGDGDGGRRAVAVSVGDGVVHHLGQRLAGKQVLDDRVRVVERVGVAAVGVDDDAAVGRRERAAQAARRAAEAHAGDRHAVGVVGTVRIVRLHVAARGVRRRVLVDGGGIVRRYRHVVDDSHLQRARARAAACVGHLQFDGIEALGGAGLAERVLERVGVAQLAGRRHAADRTGGGEAGEHQRALAGVDAARRGAERLQLGDRQGGAADRDRGQPVRRADGDGAAAGLARVRAGRAVR
ncbi:hypothetical protein APY03_2176 [Variovorax sp. WDL1]|nr:hypothetical protein APY03_2176 [Variovorax sp. WDL1]